jgi:hypothetical protein
MPASRPPGDQPPNMFAVHQPAAAVAASAGGDSGDSPGGEAPGGPFGSAAAPRVALRRFPVGRRSRRRGWRLRRPGRRLSVVAAALLLGGLACTALIEDLGRRDRPATDISSRRFESAAPAPTRKPIRRGMGKKDGAAANRRRRRSRAAQGTPGRDSSVARHRAADRPERPPFLPPAARRPSRIPHPAPWRRRRRRPARRQPCQRRRRPARRQPCQLPRRHRRRPDQRHGRPLTGRVRGRRRWRPAHRRSSCEPSTRRCPSCRSLDRESCL